MDEPPKRRSKKPENTTPEYLATYGDMITLLLCFMVLLMNPPIEDSQRLELIMASFNNLGFLSGGHTLEEGELAELGNTISVLPSLTTMKRLNEARRNSPANLEIDSPTKQPPLTLDERGLPISLAGYIFFRSGSASLDNPEARTTLQRIAQLMRNSTNGNQFFRIEGHTSSKPLEATSKYASKWELSTDRSLTVLHALNKIGVNDKNFQVSGYADTRPKPVDEQLELSKFADNVNDRVDIILIRQSHIK